MQVRWKGRSYARTKFLPVVVAACLAGGFVMVNVRVLTKNFPRMFTASGRSVILPRRECYPALSDPDPVLAKSVPARPQRFTYGEQRVPGAAVDVVFSESYKTPCWYECLTASVPDSRDDKLVGESRDGSKEVQAGTVRKKMKVLRCLPYFFLIGVAKGGTTDMYNRISRHRHVSSSHIKENSFMSIRHGRAIDWYLNFFQKDVDFISRANDSQNLIFGDASPNVMWFRYDAKTPNCMTSSCVIHKLQPRAKLIVVLREPAARLYSQYNFQDGGYGQTSPPAFHELVVRSLSVFQSCVARQGLLNCTFNDKFWPVRSTKTGVLPIPIQKGLYATFLGEWLRVFPREQFFIVRSEDYYADVPATMARLFQFLQLDTNFTKSEQRSIFSKAISLKRKYAGKMLPETNALLRKFFRDANEKLAALLKDDRFLWNDF